MDITVMHDELIGLRGYQGNAGLTYNVRWTSALMQDGYIALDGYQENAGWIYDFTWTSG
jgi:hypothetical protein